MDFFSAWYIPVITLKKRSGKLHTILIKIKGKIPFSHIWVREKHHVLSKRQGKIFFRTAENPVLGFCETPL